MVFKSSNEKGQYCPPLTLEGTPCFHATPSCHVFTPGKSIDLEYKNKTWWVCRLQPLKPSVRRVVTRMGNYSGDPAGTHGGPAPTPTTYHVGCASGKNAGILAPCCIILVSRPGSSIQSPQNQQTRCAIRNLESMADGGDHDQCFWRSPRAYVRYAIQRLKNGDFTTNEPCEAAKQYQPDIHGTPFRRYTAVQLHNCHGNGKNVRRGTGGYSQTADHVHRTHSAPRQPS